MSRKYRWTPEKYRDALTGNRAEGVKGLRSLARGFEAEDGYNLNRVDKWTAAQRRKVRDYVHRVHELEGQLKLVVRPQKESDLRRLQKGFHGRVPSKDFKVAFVPHHDPRIVQPGAKKPAPRVKLLKEGVSVQTPHYDRVVIPFNTVALVKNARKEIARVAAQMPQAKMFFVQTGNNQTVEGHSLTTVTSLILRWMEQYDGRKELPAGSGNKGDSPKHHHWKSWLEGLVGYKLRSGMNVKQMMQTIRKGRQANQQFKRERDNYFKRKKG